MRWFFPAVIALVSCSEDSDEIHPEMLDVPIVEAKNLPKKKSDFGKVICLRMDQLALLRYYRKRVSGKAMGGLMADATPRQVKHYNRTGRLPFRSHKERQEDLDQHFNNLLDIGELDSWIGCYDEIIDDCIEAGNNGISCVEESRKKCTSAKGEVLSWKSHCERFEEVK